MRAVYRKLTSFAINIQTRKGLCYIQFEYKISIIIPLYNVEQYVERAAKSIVSQKFNDSDIEVVIVDDGSTDSSLDVCLKNLQDIKGINTVSIRQENKGLSAARNAGIHAAAGEYILFLDADDFLLPNALKNICTALETEQPDVLFGRYVMWRPGSGSRSKQEFSKHKPLTWQPPTDPKKRTEYILSELPEPSWNAWRYICKRNFILSNNLYFEEGILCEDVPWTLNLLENAETISFLPEPFYAYYHRRTGSLLNSRNSEWFISLNKTIKKLLEEYRNRPIICRQLINQSFLYINEYCTFARQERMQILQAYKTILPMYKFSPSRLHHIVGKCRSSVLFWGLSFMMFLTKYLRRRLYG